MLDDTNAAVEFGPAELERKINALFGGLNTLQHIQKFALLGKDRILDFVYDDNLIRMHIPFALDDMIQKQILQASNFYEDKLLARLREFALFDERGAYFDVGANIGNHSVFFGKVMKARQITCFEPQNIASGILRRNVEINGLDGTATVVQTLVGSKDGGGRIEKHFGTRNLGATSFCEAEEGGFPMTSLDGYIAKNSIDRLDFMKVDVEGMQMPVWEGAKQLLGDLKPVLWVELRENTGEYEETVEALKPYGYKARLLGRHDFVFTVN